MDLINSVNKTEWVKFQYLAQSVAYTCLSASDEARPVSTMTSKWKCLIFTKPTIDWAQLAWSGQLESAEAINDVSSTTLTWSPANNFASIFGGSLRMAVTVPSAPTGHGRGPQGGPSVVQCVTCGTGGTPGRSTGPRVTYGATGAGTAGLDVESLIRALFEAQTTAQVALAAAQNSKLIAFHSATVQALGSKSGDKDSKLTAAKKAILQACCGQADTTSFVTPTVYLDMEVEGGTSEVIG